MTTDDDRYGGFSGFGVDRPADGVLRPRLHRAAATEPDEDAEGQQRGGQSAHGQQHGFSGGVPGCVGAGHAVCLSVWK